MKKKNTQYRGITFVTNMLFYYENINTIINNYSRSILYSDGVNIKPATLISK